MTWKDNEGRLCQMLADHRTAASAQDGDYKAFQGFAAAVKAFQLVGLLLDVNDRHESCTGHNYISVIQWKVSPAIAATGLTTAQARWLVLRFLSVKFREKENEFFRPTPDDFANLIAPQARISRIGEWLEERGLVQWQSMYGGGAGRIRDAGEEALERGLESLTEYQENPAENHVDQHVSIGSVTMHGGQLAVGPNAEVNVGMLTEQLSKLLQAIQSGAATSVEKEEAASRLAKFLEHPLVCAVVGGAVGGALGLVVPK